MSHFHNQVLKFADLLADVFDNFTNKFIGLNDTFDFSDES